jgi:hypothetical protein
VAASGPDPSGAVPSGVDVGPGAGTVDVEVGTVIAASGVLDGADAVSSPQAQIAKIGPMSAVESASRRRPLRMRRGMPAARPSVNHPFGRSGRGEVSRKGWTAPLRHVYAI